MQSSISPSPSLISSNHSPSSSSSSSSTSPSSSSTSSSNTSLQDIKFNDPHTLPVNSNEDQLLENQKSSFIPSSYNLEHQQQRQQQQHQQQPLDETVDHQSSNTKKNKPKRFVSRPLQRNQACSTCRSRKVRCDAQKPGCGACKRSAAAHGQDPDIVICQYDTAQIVHHSPLEAITNQSAIQKPSAKVIALEQKIAQIENLISDLDLNNRATTIPFVDHQSINDSYYSQNPAEIIHSSWPKCLPPRRIISHLVKLFFNFQTGSGQLMWLEPARLLTNLLLPPNHRNFPFPGLLHAIMAVAFRQLVSTDSDQLALNLLQVCNIKRYWPMELAVHRYHADRAKSWIDTALFNGTHLVQLIQTLNIYCYYTHHNAQLVQAWICSGLAVRFSTPLGLNQLESCKEHLDGNKPKPRSLLPAPQSTTEKYERAVTFWLAFQMDRFLSVSAGRPHSISEPDITSLLPAKPGTSQATIGTVDLRSNPLSLSHPHFFSLHPYDVDEFQLELKATVLLGRVTDWLIKAPDPVGFNLRKYWSMPAGPIPDLRSQTDFMQLDQDINTFIMSLSPKFYQTIFEGEGGKVSQGKVMTILIINLSVVLLHECFITKEKFNLSFERCLQATEKMKWVGDLIFGSGFDCRLLPAFASYCWAVAIRMMMRQLVQNEIKLIELATQTSTWTTLASTSGLVNVGDPLDPTNENGMDDAASIFRLLRLEEDKVRWKRIEIENLLRFNHPIHTQNPLLDLNLKSDDGLTLRQPNPEPTRENMTSIKSDSQNNTSHYQSVANDFRNINPINYQNFDNLFPYDTHHDTFSISSCQPEFNSLNLPDQSMIPAELKLTFQGQQAFNSSLSDAQTYVPFLTPQAHDTQDSHIHSRNQDDQQQRTLSQIYFDQLIKLFRIRFQAFRLPDGLSQVIR